MEKPTGVRMYVRTYTEWGWGSEGTVTYGITNRCTYVRMYVHTYFH